MELLPTFSKKRISLWYPAGVLLLLALALSITSRAGAQAPTPSQDQVNAIAKQLYCPVCENIPLDVCPTQACAQWRDLIRQKLTDGWSEQQIKDYFVAQYGDRVLAEPPRRGFNWLVYVLPPAFFLLGAFIVVRILRSTRKPVRVEPTIVEKPAEDPYLARVEEELRQRKQQGRE